MEKSGYFNPHCVSLSYWWSSLLPWKCLPHSQISCQLCSCYLALHVKESPKGGKHYKSGHVQESSVSEGKFMGSQKFMGFVFFFSVFQIIIFLLWFKSFTVTTFNSLNHLLYHQWRKWMGNVLLKPQTSSQSRGPLSIKLWTNMKMHDP